MKLEHFVKNVNTKTKKNIIVRGDEITVVERFPTGSVSLDVELGGGMPEGVIITLAGLDSDGKTSTAIMCAGGYQKKYSSKKKVLWLDAEGSWDDEWSTLLGVDVDDVWVVRPEYAEQGYQIALEALKTEDIGLIVIDSVAAMSPKAEAEGDMEDNTVALQARLHKKFLRKAQRWLLGIENDEFKPTIIAINQMTTDIGAYGNPEKEGGGKGLRYYPSIKIILKKGELFDGKKTYKYVGANDEGVEVVAQAIKFYVEKNKTAPPKRRGHFWFYFDHLDAIRTKGSVDRLEEIIRYAMKTGIVKQRSSAYDIPDPTTGEIITFKGSGKLADYIRENQSVQDWVVAQVMERITRKHEGEEVSTDDPEIEAEEQRAAEREESIPGNGDFAVFDFDDETEGIKSSEELGSRVAA